MPTFGSFRIFTSRVGLRQTDLVLVCIRLHYLAISMSVHARLQPSDKLFLKIRVAGTILLVYLIKQRLLSDRRITKLLVQMVFLVKSLSMVAITFAGTCTNSSIELGLMASYQSSGKTPILLQFSSGKVTSKSAVIVVASHYSP